MCVDYTDLNRACSKDSYPLLNIDKLVDKSVSYKQFSFMDAYFGYNKIPMYEAYIEKKISMIEQANYQ